MVKLNLCLFSTPINEEILRNILITTCKVAIGEILILSGQYPQNESIDDTYYSRML